MFGEGRDAVEIVEKTFATGWGGCGVGNEKSPGFKKEDAAFDEDIGGFFVGAVLA